MVLGRPKPPLVLSDEIKKQLETMANSRSLPFSQVRRAQIILMSAEGMTNTAIAKKVDLSIRMVGEWRQRFINQGLMGLYDQPRPGGEGDRGQAPGRDRQFLGPGQDRGQVPG